MKRCDSNSSQRVNRGGEPASRISNTIRHRGRRGFRKLIILMGIFIGIILFVYAVPQIEFVNPTLPDNNVTTNNFVYVNVSISGGNTSFIDWNNSLVGWWRMNNETGENESYVKDWSTHGNNGTVTGATYNSSGGKFGGGFEFDGDDDYINFGTISGLSEFSFSCWFKTSATAGYMTLIDGDSFILFLSSGTPRFYSPSPSWIFGTTDWRDGNWHHLVLIYNSTIARVYVDGVVQGTDLDTNNNLISTTGELTRIGLRSDNGWDFNGSIDDVQLYSRDLSPEEVNALYNSSAYRLFHNFTNLNDGNYSIKAYSQNSTGDVNSTERYVTVYTSPAITLNSPSNNAVTSNTSINFNCSASINNNLYELSNVTLYINYSGTWLANGTTSISGNSNTTTFTREYLSSDKYVVWSCYACDNESRCGFGSNGTITIDVTHPIISFTDDAPLNNSLLNYDYIFVNTTLQDVSNRIQMFINKDDSLRLWWRFNNETGENSTFVRDWSGNGNNGIVTGATYSSSGGRFGGGYIFNTTNYIVHEEKDPLGTLVSNPSLEPETEITISLWMKSTTSNANPSMTYLIRKYYTIAISNSQLRVYLYNESGSNLPTTVQGGNIDDGNWHHIVFTYNGSKAISYLDGSLLLSQNFTGKILHNTEAFYVGVPSASSLEGFNGTMDEIMIFSRALASEEVSALYNAQQNNFYHNFTNLEDSNYNFTVYAQDPVGHISSISRSFIEVWDDPRITLNYPNVNDTNIKTAAVLNVTVSNYERNAMDISFYNTTSGEVICQNNSIANGTTLICNWTNLTELIYYNWSVNATDGITTTTINNSFYVGTLISIKEFYDDRQMGVIFTGDDWDGQSGHYTGFMGACDAAQETRVVFSPGICTQGCDVFSDQDLPNWTAIQQQVDERWVIPTSHSATHAYPKDHTLEIAEDEVNGSWWDLVNNLDFPSTMKFNNSEYPLGYICPFFEWNETTAYWFNQTGILGVRGRPAGGLTPTGWGIWNNTYNFYGASKTTSSMESDYSVQYYKNYFDYDYNNRRVYHIFSHPPENWSEGSKHYSILDYIGNRTDVWYAGLGEMFAYHVVDDRNLTTINRTSGINNHNKIDVKINISSTDRNKWGLSYPMTYEISLPNSWTNVTVYYKNTSDGTYTQMIEKDRTTVWNGIDAYRKDLDNDRVYVSKAFPQTSNDMYLAIHPPDTTSPSVSFNLSSSSVNVGDAITASCTGTDTIDDNPSITSSTIDTSTSGTKTATCTITDYAGNSVSQSISYVVLSSNSGSATYSPSSEQLEEGYSKLLRKTQKVQFTINEQTHTAVINSVNVINKKVEIELEEIGELIELDEGEIKKIDLDDDGYYDLQISINKVQINGYVDLEFKEIHEEVPAEEKEEQESPSKIGEKNRLWMWISGGIISLLIIGMIIRKVLKKSMNY